MAVLFLRQSRSVGSLSFGPFDAIRRGIVFAPPPSSAQFHRPKDLAVQQAPIGKHLRSDRSTRLPAWICDLPSPAVSYHSSQIRRVISPLTMSTASSTPFSAAVTSLRRSAAAAPLSAAEAISGHSSTDSQQLPCCPVTRLGAAFFAVDFISGLITQGFAAAAHPSSTDDQATSSLSGRPSSAVHGQPSLAAPRVSSHAIPWSLCCLDAFLSRTPTGYFFSRGEYQYKCFLGYGADQTSGSPMLSQVGDHS